MSKHSVAQISAAVTVFQPCLKDYIAYVNTLWTSHFTSLAIETIFECLIIEALVLQAIALTVGAGLFGAGIVAF